MPYGRLCLSRVPASVPVPLGFGTERRAPPGIASARSRFVSRITSARAGSRGRDVPHACLEVLAHLGGEGQRETCPKKRQAIPRSKVTCAARGLYSWR
jgi:hypothetical protein